MQSLLRVPALVLLAAAAVTLTTCSDEDGAAEPSPSPTPEAFPTVERPPSPTPTPKGLDVSLGPPKPLEATPLAALPEPVAPPVIYDVQSGAVLSEGTPKYANALDALTPGIVRLDEDAFAVRATDATWLQVEMPGLGNVIHGPDGKTAAVNLNQLVLLLDLEALTVRELSLRATLVSFSPNGERLLLRDTPLSPPGLSGFIVVPLDDPALAAPLPLGSAEDSFQQGRPHWIGDTRLLTVVEKPTMLQLFETAGGDPELLGEHPIPSSQFAVSPDGSKLAVRRGDDIDHSVDVYALDPYGLLTTLEGASLGQHYDVPAEVWSPDGNRLLAVLGICGDAERLVSFDLVTGGRTELARGGFLFWVFSPDAAWVAYTAWPREAWVVPADASIPALLVAEEVHATSRPFWSGDSRYARFTSFFGGYDRCLA